MMANRRQDDERARDEADAAAREAARIGGPAPDEDVPDEQRPVVEGGGGEAEGFEQAEDALVEGATHGDPAPDPTELAGEPEQESSEAEYGEPDRVTSTERSEDPREDESREDGS
jgi:hypothetical protein